MAFTAERCTTRPHRIFPPFGAARRSIAWILSEHPPAENNVRFVPKSCAAALHSEIARPSASKRLSVSGSSVKSRDKRVVRKGCGVVFVAGRMEGRAVQGAVLL